MIEIVCATNDQDVLNENLANSPYISQSWYPEIQLMRGYKNISKAYNEAKTTSSYVMYCHQDVFLPMAFFFQVFKAIDLVPKDFGVLGVAGVKLVNKKKQNFGDIKDRGKNWFYNADKLPAEVDSLDELLLITHGDFKFDENLPHDFYGADICLQAKAQGRKNYSILANCEHNSTRPMGGRTESFYKSQEYFREKWKDWLPIVTTTAMLEK